MLTGCYFLRCLKESKSCMAKKHWSDKFLTTKSNNILSAWKFLLLYSQFTGNVNRLIASITTEKIELLQIIT